jgi:ribosomal protein S21
MRRHIWTSTTRSDISHKQSRGPAPRERYFFAPEIAEFPPASNSKAKGCGVFVQVLVRDNNVDQALRALKKKMQREGIFREMKMRDYYEKPSEKRAREKAEAVRRVRKLARKLAQREVAVAR